jgi:Transglutaminase-like superfamily
LSLSTLCVKVPPFKRIYNLLRGHHAYSGARADAAPSWASKIKRVDLATARAANAVPWKGQCLSQSIATFIMLRCRGIPATPLAGVRVLEDSSRSAHAWVDAGYETSEKYLSNSEYAVVVRIGQQLFRSTQ